MPSNFASRAAQAALRNSEKENRPPPLSAKEDLPQAGKDHFQVDRVVESVANATKRLSQISTNSSKRKSQNFVGPWKLGRTLGKGSTGRVRLAKHSSSGQLAAVKIVPKSTLNDAKDSLPYGIEREIIIMKLINHPHIMGLYDVWENKNELYLVLEYVEGGELFDYLIRNGRLGEKEAVTYFTQMISGIRYCHQFNICHRDLKPENLLLDKNQNIKIADFGMAALEAQGKLLETSCGSPHYASPEIVGGKNYHGGPSDVWSCGIILFALLTAHLPFDDPNIRDLLLKVQSGKFKMPSHLSSEAKDLIWRMLKVNPRDRITIDEIFHQPLLLKYPSVSIDKEQSAPVKSGAITHIDPVILNNLQTLWHGIDKVKIVAKLRSADNNSEKLFYRLLYKYKQEHSPDVVMESQPNSQSNTQPLRKKPSSNKVKTCSGKGSGVSASSSYRKSVSFKKARTSPEGRRESRRESKLNILDFNYLCDEILLTQPIPSFDIFRDEPKKEVSSEDRSKVFKDVTNRLSTLDTNKTETKRQETIKTETNKTDRKKPSPQQDPEKQSLIKARQEERQQSLLLAARQKEAKQELLKLTTRTVSEPLKRERGRISLDPKMSDKSPNVMGKLGVSVASPPSITSSTRELSSFLNIYNGLPHSRMSLHQPTETLHPPNTTLDSENSNHNPQNLSRVSGNSTFDDKQWSIHTAKQMTILNPESHKVVPVKSPIPSNDQVSEQTMLNFNRISIFEDIESPQKGLTTFEEASPEPSAEPFGEPFGKPLKNRESRTAIPPMAIPVKKSPKVPEKDAKRRSFRFSLIPKRDAPKAPAKVETSPMDPLRKSTENLASVEKRHSWVSKLFGGMKKKSKETRTVVYSRVSSERLATSLKSALCVKREEGKIRNLSFDSKFTRISASVPQKFSKSSALSFKLEVNPEPNGSSCTVVKVKGSSKALRRIVQGVESVVKIEECE